MSATRHRTRTTGAQVIICVLLTACGDDLPSIRYETDEVEVGTDFEDPLCVGDLDFLDAHVRRLERELDADSSDRIRIYVYADAPPCDTGGSFGCFVDDRYITTNWHAVDHEIVHAVVARFADPSDFWSEGAAEALRGTHIERGSSSPADNFDRSGAAIDYRTAGHFVRWLADDVADTSALRAFLDGSDFEAAFGLALDDALAMYDDAPWSYPPIGRCDAPDLSSAGASAWEEVIDMACAKAGTSAFGGHGISTHRRFEVTESGRFNLESSAGEGVRIIGCQSDVLDEQPPDFEDGDVYNEAGGNRVGAKLFRSGMRHELDLPVGTYDMTVTADEGERVTVALARID